jgi:AcrR family transcriptional regulator
MTTSGTPDLERWDNPGVEGEPRRLRADAERNRRRLIEAATEMFCERGLEIGVGEIARQAGVGRGTLFRNFPTKDHLIAAVVTDRMAESVARAREALEARNPGDALFDLIDSSIGRVASDRALFDAIGDTWLNNPEIRAGHHQMMDVLDQIVRRAQAAGAVRDDIGAVDVLMLIKGICEAMQAFSQLDQVIVERQLDLLWSAIATDEAQRPLRGTPPSLADLEQAKACAAKAAVPAAAEAAAGTV